MWSVAPNLIVLACPVLMCGHCRRSRFQKCPYDGAGGRSSAREVGCLWGILFRYYLEICNAHTVGSYDPLGELNPLILAELQRRVGPRRLLTR
jgi:hypothetical protein